MEREGEMLKWSCTWQEYRLGNGQASTWKIMMSMRMEVCWMSILDYLDFEHGIICLLLTSPMIMGTQRVMWNIQRKIKRNLILVVPPFPWKIKIKEYIKVTEFTFLCPDEAAVRARVLSRRRRKRVLVYTAGTTFNKRSEILFTLITK